MTKQIKKRSINRKLRKTVDEFWADEKFIERINNLVFVEGYRIWKHRFTEDGIKKVELIKHGARKMQQLLWKTGWDLFYKEVKKIGGRFHGTTISSFEKEPQGVKMFELNEGGLSTHLESDPNTARVWMTAQEDLPLLVPDIDLFNDVTKKILENRLKGKNTSILCQDLVDTYEYLDSRSEHIGRVNYLCSRIMQSYVEKVHGDMARKNKYWNVLITLTINGRTYHYQYLPQKGVVIISEDGDARINIEI